MDRSIFNAFEQALGKHAVLTGAADCIAYGFDNSAYRQNPSMVLLPTNTEQVQAAVNLARQFKLPLTLAVIFGTVVFWVTVTTELVVQPFTVLVAVAV